MHIPEMRLLCVAYSNNLKFDENDVVHLTECPSCYEQWKVFLEDGNWQQLASDD